MNSAERFWAKVEIRGDDDCWPWIASIGTWGYGSFWIEDKNVNASNFAWRLVHGELPAGHLVRHTCDWPRCCNPCHLINGTQAQNLEDARSRGRQRYLRGSEHHRSSAKLSPELVRKARELYRAGVTQIFIGEFMGVDSSTISRAVRGDKWAHIV